MKRKYRLWQMLVLTVLGAAIVLSLMIPERLLSGPEPKRVEVSILPRHTDSALWAAARQGMEQAAEDFGAELRFLSLSQDNDVQEQIDLLYREAEIGTDAAVVVPADCARLSQALMDKNTIPVVSLESPLEGAVALVCPDNNLIGQLLASQIKADFPRGGRGLLIDSSPGADGITERLKVTQKVLEEAGFELTVSPSLPEPEEFFSKDFVICFEAQMLDSAAQQASEASFSPKIYGAGVTDSAVARLERRQITALAAGSEYAAGYLSVAQAVATARNEDVEDAQISVSIVREGDTYDPDHQKLLYPINR